MEVDMNVLLFPPNRLPLIVATVCLVVGNVLYAFLYVFEGMGSVGVYSMMFTRLLIGTSGGELRV